MALQAPVFMTAHLLKAQLIITCNRAKITMMTPPCRALHDLLLSALLRLLNRGYIEANQSLIIAYYRASTDGSRGIFQ